MDWGWIFAGIVVGTVVVVWWIRSQTTKRTESLQATIDRVNAEHDLLSQQPDTVPLKGAGFEILSLEEGQERLEANYGNAEPPHLDGIRPTEKEARKQEDIAFLEDAVWSIIHTKTQPWVTPQAFGYVQTDDIDLGVFRVFLKVDPGEEVDDSDEAVVPPFETFNSIDELVERWSID